MNSRIGIFGLLGVVFVAFKVAGIIDWSWWLVTLPFWGGFILLLLVMLLALVIWPRR